MCLSAAVLTLAGGSVWAAGTTWRVANDGTDSGTCGNANSPCRSISQAMENASAGDIISVGAGIYGNISGDGSFTHPGDEHPQLVVRPRRTGTDGCIICITKPLKVLSLHGASTTIIVGTSSTTYPATVQITSPGATFGGVGQGFTITGGNAIGVYVDQDAVDPVLQKNINVVGNVDQADGTGFSFKGLQFTDRPCPDPSCLATATVFFTNNQARGNGTGFAFEDNAFTGSASFKNNVASGAGTGFVAVTGFQSETGAASGAGNVSLSGNVAIHDGYGFSLAQTGPIIGNSAFANSNAGFLVVPGAVFQGNSVIGNGGPGMIVQDSSDVFDDANNDPIDQFRVFDHNNFYGNDRNRPALTIRAANEGTDQPGINPGPSAHCGILNVGKAAAAPGQPGPENGDPTSPKVVQTAANNFWGSAKGPSPTGPGDAAGGACDQNGGVTVAKPFATVDFAITTAP